MIWVRRFTSFQVIDYWFSICEVDWSVAPAQQTLRTTAFYLFTSGARLSVMFKHDTAPPCWVQFNTQFKRFDGGALFRRGIDLNSKVLPVISIQWHPTSTLSVGSHSAYSAALKRSESGFQCLMNSDVVLVFTVCRQTGSSADSLPFSSKWHREIKRAPERHRGLSSATKQK